MDDIDIFVDAPNDRKVDKSMFRSDGSKKSATGFLGPIKNLVTGGTMTEFTTEWEDAGIEIPTMVPTLSAEEVEYMRRMKPGQGWDRSNPIDASILRKAKDHARMRIKQGISPYYQDGEDQAKQMRAGGIVDNVDIFGYNLGGSVSEMMNPVERELPSLSPAQIANLGGSFAIGSGTADIFGEYPEFPSGDVSIQEMMEGPRSPSMSENLREGSYLSAALQGLGGLGDAAYALPVVGPLAAGVLKAPRIAQKGLKAYHGSPHKMGRSIRVLNKQTGETFVADLDNELHLKIISDSDKYEPIGEISELGMFDDARIGSGEGAQAYGFGHYLAQNEKVSEGYREELRKNYVTLDDGKKRPYGLHLDAVENAIKNKFPELNPQDSRRYARDVVDNNLTLGDVEGFGSYPGSKGYRGEDIYLSAIEANKKSRPSEGYMYEVMVDASVDDLLDYDLPFKDQSKGIQESLIKAGFDPSEVGAENLKGRNLYFSVLDPETLTQKAPQEASRKLKEAGIKGIRYDDGFSRRADDNKTSNYVIFDPRLIEITRQYGIPVASAGALLAAMDAEQVDSDELLKADGGEIRKFKKGGDVDLDDIDIFESPMARFREPVRRDLGPMQMAIPEEEGLRDRAERLLAGLMGDDREDYRRAEKALMAADVLPVLGDVGAAADLSDAIEKGDLSGAGIAALGLIPVVGGVASRTLKGSRGAFRSPSLEKQRGSLGIVSLDSPIEDQLSLPLGEQKRLKVGYYHPVSGGLKLKTLPKDMDYELSPSGVLVPSKTIKPEDMEGGRVIFDAGDRAVAGQKLVRINGIDLEFPIDLMGGPQFMMYQKHLRDNGGIGSIWASDQGAITSLTRQAVGDEDVYFMPTAMTQTGLDFNTMMSDALIQQADKMKITKKSKKAFDKAVKNIRPEWKGIDSPEARDQLLENGPLRHAFVDRMDQAEFQSMGFPDVAQTRVAITDPSYLDLPFASGGMTVGKVDKGNPILNKKGEVVGFEPVESPNLPHPTYSTQLSGDYVGGFEVPVPRQLLAPDFYKKRREMGVGTGGDARSFQLTKPTQQATPEWVDTISEYIEQVKANQ